MSKKIDSINQTTKVIALCKKVFSQFDEIWLIGHKGDHHQNLIEFGIIKENAISVAHVYSTLGIKAKYIITPPENGDDSMKSLVTELNPLIEKYVQLVIKKQRKVCVLMPFPNLHFEELIKKNNAESNFIMTAPVPDYTHYLKIENKLNVEKIVRSALSTFNNNEYLDNLLIPSIGVYKSDLNFSFFKKYFKLVPNQGIYVQKGISGGGDATNLVKSQKEMNQVMKNKIWKNIPKNEKIKISPEVKNIYYHTSGSVCVIPRDDKNCIVILDPLGHKPTGIKELQGKDTTGVGNDWSTIWSEEIQQQYKLSAIAIGKELYRLFGFTGIFGPDYIIEKTEDNKFVLRLTELNPRCLGTTPYHTINALIANRIPTELVYYILKLDSDGLYTNKLLSLIGNIDNYNNISLYTKGCFYIKICSPTNSKKIQNDMNGFFIFTGQKIIGPFKNLNYFDIFSKNINYQKILQYFDIVDKYNDDWIMIYVKAPNKSDILKASLVTIGYIIGYSNNAIFSTDRPTVTRYGKKLYDLVITKMYNP